MTPDREYCTACCIVRESTDEQRTPTINESTEETAMHAVIVNLNIADEGSAAIK